MKIIARNGIESPDHVIAMAATGGKTVLRLKDGRWGTFDTATGEFTAVTPTPRTTPAKPEPAAPADPVARIIKIRPA